MIDITRARSVARLHLDNGMVVSETDAKLICQALLAGGPLDAIRQKSAQMAEDAGLWFKAETCAEAYVQQELRKLCALIEQQPETVSDERDGAVAERSAARSEHISPERRRGLEDAAKALADAADDVGVKFFDTDTMEPEVERMQKATLAVRALIPPSSEGGSPR
jgi:hypothetical protein